MDFEDWMQTTRFYIHLYPQRQRVPLLLHALPQELFFSAIKVGVTPDSDMDYCCEILFQLAIDQRERSLAREFFHRDQKVGENDEDYARSLKLLAFTGEVQCSARLQSILFCSQGTTNLAPPFAGELALKLGM
ncbi:unnamed protein product [Taenia asiatica]|uniref:DUF5726 domain-containing protein n=1 Tax=Taenia asiatica TaxID=60517 RepID=A0A0R3VVW1_TAEAS|nr:unnamed protein product [Taenia asiatica]